MAEAELLCKQGRLCTALVLQNHLRDRLFLGVRNGKSCIFHPELGGELSGFAVKCHGGPASGHADHLAIPPAHAMIPSRAQSLHRSFLGGEARGITLNSVSLGIAIANL